MTGKIQGPALRVLPLGSLRPTGWLRGQLGRQRDGMAGKLDEFWPDVAQSAWIGGSAEGWERGPYWLDGIVPLAFLLDDPTLMAKATRWVEHILGHQAEDGWMGPKSGDPSLWHHADFGDYDVWPRMVLLKALLQYHSATGDERIVPAALRLARRIDEVLAQFPLHEWGRVRWADLVWCLHDLYASTGEEWLLDVAERANQQGYDWTSYAEKLPYRDKVSDNVLYGYQEVAEGLWMNDDFLATHGANIGMGVKALPVWWRHTGDETLRSAFTSMLAQLDEHHGQATGLFTCDEHLAGRNPSQGSETCTLVEFMLSLEVAIETWGVTEDVADRLERLAFNALPASASADEWAHQYDQQANQVICHVVEDRIYTNNGPASNTFSLAPHFGCCTANRHQGWPKFAARLWMRTADDGLAALSYAPCEIDTELRGQRVRVAVGGEYPFGDEVTITVETDEAVTAPLHLRVPGWAVAPTLVVDGGDAIGLDPGTVHVLERTWSGDHVLTLALPAALTTQERYHDAVTVQRGPLVFALAVGEDWRQIGGELPHADWEVHPTTPWNYALEVDPAAPTAGMEVETRPLHGTPFTPEGAPIRLRATARQVPGWEMEQGAAAPPPASPVEPAQVAETPEPVVLLPYGAARLRVTELPWVERA